VQRAALRRVASVGSARIIVATASTTVSPSPSTAHVLERTSMQFAVHKQCDLNLPGQCCRADLLQE
jgi:hypothetical protein